MDLHERIPLERIPLEERTGNLRYILTSISGVPSLEYHDRLTRWLDCVEHLVAALPDESPDAVRRIANARTWVNQYTRPVWSVMMVYDEARFAGVPKEQLDALVALHLT